MPLNVKSVVAQCYRGWRSIGSRHFCSQPHNGESLVGNRSTPSLVPRKSPEVLLFSWVMAGYATYFAWEMLCLDKVERKMDRDIELRSERRKEMLDKHRGLGISID